MSADKRQTDSNSPQPPAGSPGPPQENPLSEREMEVSRLLVTGATNSEIARELVISPQTVKVHLRNVFEKLQVSSRTEASMVLLRRGWLTVPGVSTARAPEAPPPDPEPLADRPGQPQLWQWGMLAGGLLVCLFALLLPNMLGRAKSPVGLLSDSGQTLIGKPALEVLPRWSALPAMPTARSRLAVAQMGQRIYALGGEGADGQTLDLIEVFDLRQQQWHPGPTLPEPLANAAATFAGDRIVVAGGSALGGEEGLVVTVSDRLYLLDPEGDAWQRGGVLPVSLAGASLVSLGDSVYLIGGWDGTAMHDEVWQLPLADLETAAASDWTTVTRLPVAAAFLGATVVEGEIVVVGGYDGKRELADAAAYAVRFNIWRRLPPLAAPRSGVTLVYDGMAMLALGGGWTHATADHERFDPLTSQWTVLESPISGEWRHFGAVFNEGSVYLIGGWSGDYLDTTLQYRSTFRALLPAIQNIQN